MNILYNILFTFTKDVQLNSRIYFKEGQTFCRILYKHNDQSTPLWELRFWYFLDYDLWMNGFRVTDGERAFHGFLQLCLRKYTRYVLLIYKITVTYCREHRPTPTRD